jgi:hypothetical protein
LPEGAWAPELFWHIDISPLDNIYDALERGDGDALFQLEAFRARCSIPHLIVAAEMLEMQHHLSHNDLSRAEVAGKRGAAAATFAEMPAEESVFRSQVARLLVIRGSALDFRLAADAGATALTGFILYDEEKFKADADEVSKLYVHATDELNKALSLARDSKNLDALYWALCNTGTAEAQKASSAALLASVGLAGQGYMARALERAQIAHENAIRVAGILGHEALARAITRTTYACCKTPSAPGISRPKQ